MKPAVLVFLALKSGVILNVFLLGLRTNPQDALYLLRRPGQLFRSLLSMNIVMPLIAAAMIALFDLHPAVEVALVVLSVSPIPPMLPKKALKAGGEASYTISLLLTAALLAIVFVPLAVDLLGRAFERPSQISPMAVAAVVAMNVLTPLAAGLLVGRLSSTFAERVSKPISYVSLTLIIAGIVPILFTSMPDVVSLIGNGTLVAITAFIFAGLAVGHLLGGPEPDDRTVLALTTSSRHPGVAAAISGANFPGEQSVLAAILLYVLMNATVSIPYRIWRRRSHAERGNAGLK